MSTNIVENKIKGEILMPLFPIVAASYMVGRGFSSIFWGIIADRIGRKPVITFSILSVYVLQKFQV
jgi:MFS family permease